MRSAAAAALAAAALAITAVALVLFLLLAVEVHCRHCLLGQPASVWELTQVAAAAVHDRSLCSADVWAVAGSDSPDVVSVKVGS